MDGCAHKTPGAHQDAECGQKENTPLTTCLEDASQERSAEFDDHICGRIRAPGGANDVIQSKDHQV
jgi:hypothetical protein